MSVIEDTRKLRQDFLAPEVRELTARVEALEKRMDIRFDAVEKRMDSRFVAVEERIGKLEDDMNSGFAGMERLASERHSQTLQAIDRLSDIYYLRTA